MDISSIAAKYRVWIFLAAFLIPIGLAVLGIVRYFRSPEIDTSFIQVHIIVPVIITVVLLALLILRLRSDIELAILLATIIVFLGFAVLVNSRGLTDWIRSWEGDEALERYAKIEENWPLMPSVDELGDPIHVEYHDFVKNFFMVFVSNSDVLICKYDCEEYAEKKAELDEAYVFETRTMVSCDESCEPDGELDGFYFRMLSFKEYWQDYNLDFPNRLIIIGTNDETQEIAYIAFYDTELDLIYSLSDFVYRYCGWRHIR